MFVSRILFPDKIGTAVIYLVAALLPQSSGLPEGVQGEQPCLRDNPAESFCLTLHQVGFALSRLIGISFETSNITIGAVGFYPAFSPLSRFKPGRYFFCGTFRVLNKSAPRELPGTLFCGVRTFLYSRRFSLNSNCST